MPRPYKATATLHRDGHPRVVYPFLFANQQELVDWMAGIYRNWQIGKDFLMATKVTIEATNPLTRDHRIKLVLER